MLFAVELEESASADTTTCGMLYLTRQWQLDSGRSKREDFCSQELTDAQQTSFSQTGQGGRTLLLT